MQDTELPTMQLNYALFTLVFVALSSVASPVPENSLKRGTSLSILAFSWTFTDRLDLLDSTADITLNRFEAAVFEASQQN
jgi:hypothetical protein